jgi:hypothetical protein
MNIVALNAPVLERMRLGLAEAAHASHDISACRTVKLACRAMEFFWAAPCQLPTALLDGSTE